MDAILPNLNLHPWEGVYIHLPFCRNLCPFCTFPVVKWNEEKAQNYLQALLLEIQFWQNHFPEPFSQVRSVYFGGGTPSVYPPEKLFEILQALRLPQLSTKKGEKMLQISIELNPEDARVDFLQALKDQGWNRFSFGIQTFSSLHLQKIGRKHTAKQNHQCLEAIAKVGITNFNLDWIYGYPTYGLKDVNEDLTQFLNANPTHISAYNLTLEPNSRFYSLPEWQKFPKQNEDLVSQEFLTLHAGLQEGGFPCYEVSNFAKPGYESSQNEIYWQGKNYLGLGLGAFSAWEKDRMQNERKFYAWLELFSKPGLFPASKYACPAWEKVEKISQKQRLDEYFLIQLRRPSGLDPEKMTALYPNFHWGHFLEKACAPLKKNWLVQTKNCWQPSPEGLLVADFLALQLSSALEKEW